MSLPPPPPPPPQPSPQPPSYGGTSFPNYGAPPPGYTAYPSGGQPLAGLGARFLALFLDNLLYGLVGAVLAVPGILFIIRSLKDCVTEKISSTETKLVCPPGSPKGGLLALGIVLIVLGLLLVAVLYIRALGKTGQTWGRKMAGVKVVDKGTGAPIGMGRALGRTLFEQVISRQICFLGYLWAIWDKDKQTWHDKVVNSIVVTA